ncbi:MAG: glyoxalase [Proteobacteria bacterium]|nr:MAG: glyoxalase [Pseudomonadota bacterium]
MPNLNTVEIKAFLPAKDFDKSKQFYEHIGFIKASDSDGVAYFRHGNCSFLLQDFYVKEFAENLVIHLLVEDIKSWHTQVRDSGIEHKFKVKVSDITKQPWGMLDFHVHDPSGVLWRFGQNTPA